MFESVNGAHRLSPLSPVWWACHCDWLFWLHSEVSDLTSLVWTHYLPRGDWDSHHLLWCGHTYTVYIFVCIHVCCVAKPLWGRRIWTKKVGKANFRLGPVPAAVWQRGGSMLAWGSTLRGVRPAFSSWRPGSRAGGSWGGRVFWECGGRKPTGADRIPSSGWQDLLRDTAYVLDDLWNVTLLNSYIYLSK